MDVVNGFPIDLVLFGMIAAFLVLRLRSILGRRTGFERPPQPYQRPPQAAPGPASAGSAAPGSAGAGSGAPPVIEGRAEVVSPSQPAGRPVPDPASTLGRVIEQMRGADRNFEPARFLDGAEQAFRIIVAAFARGDRAALRGLVGDHVYRAFDQAIGAREHAGHAHVSEIRDVTSATIDDAELRGSVAQITVRFVSDQVNMTRDVAGQIITGADAVTEIVDIWTFERDLTAREPTWRLVAVRAG